PDGGGLGRRSARALSAGRVLPGPGRGRGPAHEQGRQRQGRGGPLGPEVMLLLAQLADLATAAETPAADTTAETTAASAAGPDLTEQRAERPTVLVLRKVTASMDSFVRGMVGELDPDFNVAALVVDKETTTEALKKVIAERKPEALVILDNPTAELY